MELNNNQLKKRMYLLSIFGDFFPERAIFIIYYLSIGLSPISVSLIQGTISVTQFILEVPTGAISDKIGRKKTLLIGSLCQAIYFLILLLSRSLSILLIANFFLGLGLTLRSGADESYIYENIDDYKKTLRIYTGIGGVSLGIAILIGGFLSLLNWDYVFLTALIFHIIGTLICLLLNEEKKVTEGSSVKESFIDFKKTLKELVHAKQFFIIIAFIIIDSYFWFYYMISQVSYSNRGLDTFSVSLIFFIISIIILIINYFDIQENKYGNSILFLIIILSTILAMNFYIKISEGLGITIITTIILLSQLYLYLFLPLLSENIHNILSDNHRNKLMSMIYSLSSIVIWLLFLIYGFLSEFIDGDTIIYGLFIIVSSSLIIIIKKLKREII